MSNNYPFGNPVRIDASFVDEAGDPFAPTGDVVFKVKRPDGTLSTYTFGADDEVEQDSASSFHMWVRPTNQSGTWTYGAQALNGSSEIDCADSGEFEIEEDAFA